MTTQASILSRRNRASAYGFVRSFLLVAIGVVIGNQLQLISTIHHQDFEQPRRGLVGLSSDATAPILRSKVQAEQSNVQDMRRLTSSLDISKERRTSSLPISKQSQIATDAEPLMSPRQFHPIHQDYVQVFEDFLPPESVQQEGGACQIGSKLYLAGGLRTMVTDKSFKKPKNSDVVTIYDMATMEVSFGPKLPKPIDHVTCAVSPSTGTIHVSGSFGAWSTTDSLRVHYAWNPSTSESNGSTGTDKTDEWKEMAPYPVPSGAHGCEFGYDNRMYCAGGAAKQWGPFYTYLWIYSPATDEWSEGAPMREARDHIMSSIVAFDDRRKLYVSGGRGHRLPGNHPAFWTNVASAEVYDIDTNQWVDVSAPLVTRSDTDSVLYQRPGHDGPSILISGGEGFVGLTGQVFATLEEYDVEKDIYYCHRDLPFPQFGGMAGIYEHKLHIVGGADWFGFGATRRVQIYDLLKAPKPKPCTYRSVAVFDEFDLSFDKGTSFPEMEEEMCGGCPGKHEKETECKDSWKDYRRTSLVGKAMVNYTWECYMEKYEEDIRIRGNENSLVGAMKHFKEVGQKKQYTCRCPPTGFILDGRL